MKRLSAQVDCGFCFDVSHERGIRWSWYESQLCWWECWPVIYPFWNFNRAFLQAERAYLSSSARDSLLVNGILQLQNLIEGTGVVCYSIMQGLVHAWHSWVWITRVGALFLLHGVFWMLQNKVFFLKGLYLVCGYLHLLRFCTFFVSLLESFFGVSHSVESSLCVKPNFEVLILINFIGAHCNNALVCLLHHYSVKLGVRPFSVVKHVFRRDFLFQFLCTWDRTFSVQGLLLRHNLWHWQALVRGLQLLVIRLLRW